MDPGGQRAITLVVKTPNKNYGDQVVDGVDVNWTVKDLKVHLHDVYPTNPAVSDQRLIYAGKLLPDHLQIKDIFRQTDCVPTLHLVCTFRTPAAGLLGAKPKVMEKERSPLPGSSAHANTVSGTSPSTSPSTSHSPTPASAPPSPSTAPLLSAALSPELRRRHEGPVLTQFPDPGASASWPGTAPPGAAHLASPSFPTYSLYSPQHLLWLQHAYARQYYMQYQAALAAASTASPGTAAAIVGPYPPVPVHQAPVPAVLHNPNPIDNLPADQIPAQDAAFINAGAANQNMRMNAQGGAVMEDEEEMERDWLDWMYSAARLGVLLMIVYFNSSLSRFIMVMSTLLLMYIHTAGWFPFRRRVQVQRNQQNPNRNPVPIPAEEAVDQEAERPPNAAAEPGAPVPMTAVLVPAYRVSVVWTAWVFFKTFFSSLIPEVPQVMAN